MRRTLVLLVTGLVAVGLTAPSAAAAQEEAPPDASTTTQPPREDSVILKPDSGRPPDDAGDRGGALQVGLFLAIVAGLGTVAALGIRESRRKQPSSA